MKFEVKRLRCAAALFAGALVLLALSACGGSNDRGEGVELPTAEPATRASGTLILATATSTYDSGLLDVLVPLFERETGYTVRVVAVGSGQAIEQGSRGAADVVLSHIPAVEQIMVAAGDGIDRTYVMYNDFVIVGPPDDPANVQFQDSLDEAMEAIATTNSRFIGRGDNSAHHSFELRLWNNADVELGYGRWYEESGEGIGATLRLADERRAYTVSDRANFVAQSDAVDLEIVREGDEGLVNVYHVIVVNPEKHPEVNVTAARAFVAFLTRADIQQVIGEYGIDEYGQPLFIPAAGKEPPSS